MLIELFMTPIFALVGKGFELIRMDRLNIPIWLGDTLDLLANAMMFFPVDVWVVVMANVVFWITAHLAWASFEWLYKKIPGIN